MAGASDDSMNDLMQAVDNMSLDAGKQYSSGGQKQQLENCIKEACSKAFIVYYEGGKQVHRAEVTGWNSLYVQFIFMHFKEDIMKRITGIDSMKMDVNGHVLEIRVSCHGYSNIHTQFENAVEDYSKLLTKRRLPGHITDHKRKEIAELCRQNATKDLSVYQDEKKELIVIGTTEETDRFLKRIEDPVQSLSHHLDLVDRWIELENKDHFLFIQKLHFEKWFHQDNKSVISHFEFVNANEKFYLKCCCAEEMMIQIKTAISNFLSRIHIYHLKQQLSTAELVLLRNNAAFVEREIEKHDVYGMWKILNEQDIDVFTRSSEDSKKVARIIQECFQKGKVTVEMPEFFYFTTASFKDLKNEEEHKTLMIERKNGCVAFTALKSTAQKMNSEMGTYAETYGLKSLPITCVQAEAVCRWKKDLGKLLQKDTDHAELAVGSENEIQQLRNFLVQIFAEGKYIYRNVRLLQRKPAKEYFEKKLRHEKANVEIDIESDHCISILACSENDTARAEKVLSNAICSQSICYTDNIKERILSPSLKRVACDGKYLFDGFPTSDEGELYATDDMMQEILQYLSCTAGPVTPREVQHVEKLCLSLSEEQFEYLAKYQMKKVKDLKNENGIEISFENNELCIKGSPNTVKTVFEKAKKVKEEISKAILVLPDPGINLSEEMKQVARESQCVIAKKTLIPTLANCWLLEKSTDKKNFPKLFRIHHIAEHAETLEVDVLVTPCTNVLFPLKECYRSYGLPKMMKTPKKCEFGEFLVEDTVLDLPCHRIIYLVTRGANSENDKPEIQNWIHSVLKCADDLKLRSIAIPLDLLPEKEMTLHMQANEIQQALKKPPQLRYIEEVYLCECSDEPTEGVERRLRNLAENEVLLSFKELQQNVLTTPYNEIGMRTTTRNIQIDIVLGSLVNQKVDVMVNTTGRSLKLSEGGMMSRTIHLKAGGDVQKELNNCFANGIKFGDVAVTEGGGLPCRFIFHVALYDWTTVGNFSLTVLKLIVWQCLQKAEEKNCHQISFPSLGTGNLGYPWRLVAETMFHTVHCYEQAKKNTCINKVMFVLPDKEEICVKDFQSAQRNQDNLLQQKMAGSLESLYFMDDSQFVTVYLTAERSKWKWGSLLRIAWDSTSDKMIYRNQEEDCLIYMNATLNENLASVLRKYRISTVELILMQGDFGKQIENFLSWMSMSWMNSTKLQYVQYLFIVFRNSSGLNEYISNHQMDNWRQRTNFPLPVILRVTGNAEAVPKVMNTLQASIQKQAGSESTSLIHPTLSQQNSLDGMQIFESVSGTISPLLQRDVVEKTVHGSGCVLGDDKSNGISVTATGLADLLKLNQKLTEYLSVDEKSEGREIGEEESTSYSPRPQQLPLVIKMSECEFNSFKYFGEKRGLQAFKSVANNLEYKNGELLACVNNETTKSDLKSHYENIKIMNTDEYAVPTEHIGKIPAVVKEIQIEHPEACVYGGQLKITITCDQYDKLQITKTAVKLKVEGEQKSRRNRRFLTSDDKSDSQTEVKKEGGRNRRRFVSDGSDSRPSASNTENFGDTLEVKTKEGLIVKVYQESITRLAVDCIVNAANESLNHGGGVALAISQAAGYGFDQESMEYIRKHGQIPIGECCVTGAGNLPYQYVIHTVGPRWFAYKEDEKKDCLDDLQQAVEVTFKKAEELGLSSIALPAISSGIFGVPKDKCVEQYYRAVVSFSGSNKCYSLKEIHFVDRDFDMVENIKASFIRLKEDSSPQLHNLSSTAHNTTVLVQKKNDPNPAEQNYEYKPPLDDGEDCCMFDVTKSLSIYFSVGDILKSKADAVVCPQDKKCKSREEDAKAFFNYINDSTAFPKVEERDCRFGKVIPMEIKKSNVPWSCILHTVAPNFDGASEEEKFKKNLQKTYENVFNEADYQKISKIAMPVLGLGASNIHQKPIEICAESFANAVQSFVSDDSQYLREVTVVFRSKADKFAYSDGMKKVGYDDICLLPNVAPAEEENCCICMDTLTNPKRLHKCGHVFCTECIEQQFKYKPACPSCGQLYGKMTGDQPPGSVFVRKDKRSRLPGYEECDGCIIITYTIKEGYQGDEHPNPTKYFKGISRSGYIPNNTKGRLVVKLLNVAFTRRLVFTIGRSRTTGEEGVVTWNDIHHKTRPEGGPQRFGYPDPTYLDRVLEELDAKGVSPESADDPKEYMEYSRCFR